MKKNFLPPEKYFPSLPKKRVGAGVIVFDQLGKMLLVKPYYKDHWTIPGGVVEKDESPREGAKREMKEETGLGLDDLFLRGVSYVKNGPVAGESLQFFFGEETISEEKKKKIRGEEDEITDWGFFDLKEVEKKVGKKRFKTLTAFFGKNGKGYREDVREE